MTDALLPPRAGGADRASLGAAGVIALAVAAHCLIWTVGPTLLVGNLHTDTLEAAYWGRAWAFGYEKHPPLVSWLIDLALRSGSQPIFALMALSQATVAVTAFFVWRTTRLYGSRADAALAVALYLVAPAASVYAVQINHNSILLPFAAATLFFGLRYLERRRWADALALGAVAALGVLTKYENAFFLVVLLGLAAAIPRFRPAFPAIPSYVCVVLFALLLAPHALWLQANHWPSAQRALGVDKITSVSALLTSASNSLVGVVTLLAAPGLVLFFTRRGRTIAAPSPDARSIGRWLAFGPLVVMFIAGAATYQIIKPLWVVPLAASTAVGLALLAPAGRGGEGVSARLSAIIAVCVSALFFLGFAGFLFVTGAVGKPFSAYAPDTRKLAVETQALWDARHGGPLRCIVVAERKIGPSGVLWLKDRPDYVDLSSPSWRTPAQVAACRRTGGVEVLANAADAADAFPQACAAQAQDFMLPAAAVSGKGTWAVRLVYLPPGGAGCGP